MDSSSPSKTTIEDSVFGETNSLSGRMESTSEAYYIPVEIASIGNTFYHVVLPLFIAVNLAVNCLCLFVTTRPKFKTRHVNMYIQLMTVLDLVSSVVHIPVVFDFDYCVYSNYGLAFYFTHFGWLLIYLLRSLGASTLVCLSFDRFMAIWYSQTFQKVKHHSKKTLGMIYIWTIVSYIPIMSHGTIIVQGEDRFVSLPSYRIKDSNFLAYYMPYLQLCFGVLPSLAIIGLSIGLATGVFRNLAKGGSLMNNKKFYQVLAVLGLNLSYVLCIFPFYFVAAMYEVDEGGCLGNFTNVTSTIWTQGLVMTWSTLNILIFFMLSKDYRKELKLIANYIPCIKNKEDNITELDSGAVTDNTKI